MTYYKIKLIIALFTKLIVSSCHIVECYWPGMPILRPPFSRRAVQEMDLAASQRSQTQYRFHNDDQETIHIKFYEDLTCHFQINEKLSFSSIALRVS